jgi:hypothetical protein
MCVELRGFDPALELHAFIRHRGGAALVVPICRWPGWLKNCASYNPCWSEAAIDSGVLVDGGPVMPPKDMHYDPALIEFISRRA